jgi:hypothetical protein
MKTNRPAQKLQCPAELLVFCFGVDPTAALSEEAPTVRIAYFPGIGVPENAADRRTADNKIGL